MEIKEGIEIIGSSLYLKDHKTLVISDLHIGYEESLNRQGVFIPRFQFSDIQEQIDTIRKKTAAHGGIKTIILNGDLKHEFGKITNQEWRELRKLFRNLAEKSEVVIVKGNHDAILSPVAEMEKVSIIKEMELGSVLIIHGDELPKNLQKNIQTIIIGHEHPAISLSENNRIEKFKCFLKGEWKNTTLIAMPSFNPIVEGTDILKEQVLSPFLKQDISNFEIWVAAEETLYFGKVKNLR